MRRQLLSKNMSAFQHRPVQTGHVDSPVIAWGSTRVFPTTQNETTTDEKSFSCLEDGDRHFASQVPFLWSSSRGTERDVSVEAVSEERGEPTATERRPTTTQLCTLLIGIRVASRCRHRVQLCFGTMVRRDKTNLPPARFLEPPGTVREPSVLPPLGVKHIPQPRGSQSSTDGGTNTAERAVHRASKKGYTAGRLPVYEPKIRTPATTKAWCDSVRASNQLMSAGSPTGWLGGNRQGRREFVSRGSHARPPREKGEKV